ncbi:hypothetical protein BDB01DRAFT_478616 [Pilobolus umbonatus]|nr:hypothetical protein BDB01DRAFT_478616 [Pilobolus umbonatus]
MVFTSPLGSFPIPNQDLFTFLFSGPNDRQADKNKPIVTDGESGQYYTWSQVKEQSRYLAQGWVEQGKQGQTVAVFAPNHLDHYILYFSLLGAQCTISPGNPAYTEAEFEHQLTNSKASMLVTVPALLPILLPVCQKIGIPTSSIYLFGDSDVQGCRTFNSIKSSTLIPMTPRPAKDEVAFICYSSGTTGVAKGVMLSHQNMVSQILLAVNNEVEITNEDVNLGFLPLYHVYGLTSLVFNSYYRVIPVVLMAKFDLQLLCTLIEKYKITMASIVPPVAVLLAKHPIVSNYDLSSIRLLGCGAAPLSKEHIDALQKRIPADIVQGYGMTETTSGVISQSIVDEHGNELGPDQQGEFLFRGPSIMVGYFNNPKANAEVFTADGWMRTGDVGKFDSASGEYFILDRIKELIKYKGFQIAPAELEALLMSMDFVADCCVIGVYDHQQATEIPRAYVVLQPGVEPSAKVANTIREHVAQNVTNYKWLRGGVKFVDAVPKSPSGKILRREVKEWVKKEEEEIKAKL